MPPPRPLFTPRFFVMCGFSFTVFISAFQLFPTAPFHIRDLGGSTFAAGLFLGLLTYASACSAPFTGAFADRIGHRRMLQIGSLAISGFSVAYALAPSPAVMLALVVPHGIFWSGLMVASGAYVTALVPEERRAEGIGYWGLSTVLAIALAPNIGFLVYRRGWLLLCGVMLALNLIMAAIAWSLEELHRPADPSEHRFTLEWRVLVVSLCVFLYSFGYGGVTSFSAMYAEAEGISPRAIYLTSVAAAILLSRPFAARLGDRFGYRRVFLPSMIVAGIGLAVLAVLPASRGAMIASAAVFGAGYGTAWPVFMAYMLGRVDSHRRGAAYGAMIAALDTGIGTGSTALGWIIQQYGYAAAFGFAAALSSLAVPYFLVADRAMRTVKSQS
ncbi:MAG: MFS transporter [Acidobacteria bacterium]|nr:MFS transporter [Acidobacteriota bacterium]